MPASAKIPRSKAEIPCLSPAMTFFRLVTSDFPITRSTNCDCQLSFSFQTSDFSLPTLPFRIPNLLSLTAFRYSSPKCALPLQTYSFIPSSCYSDPCSSSNSHLPALSRTNRLVFLPGIQDAISNPNLG